MVRCMWCIVVGAMHVVHCEWCNACGALSVVPPSVCDAVACQSVMQSTIKTHADHTQTMKIKCHCPVRHDLLLPYSNAGHVHWDR